MASPYDTIKSAVLGDPIDPNKQPSRTGVVKAFSEMQTQLEASQSGAFVRATKASLDDLLVAPVSAMAWVTSDTDQTKCGIYQNTGTATAAIWTRRADIPQFTVTGINVGAGTANAIQVTTDRALPVQSGRALVIIPIVAVNTIAGPTVSINGGTPLQIVSNTGAPVSVGGMPVGSFLAGFVSSNKFRLINDQDVSAIVASAEAEVIAAATEILNDAQDAATAAQASEDAAAASATEAAMYAEMVGAAVYDFNFDSDPETPGYDWNS